MSRRHAAARRRSYGRRQHELRERRLRDRPDDGGWLGWLRGDRDTWRAVDGRSSSGDAAADREHGSTVRSPRSLGHGSAPAGDAA